MKFTVTMKDPDHSISTDGNDNSSNAILEPRGLKLKANYMEWDEYLTVEFDTETGTARVVPVKEMGN